VELTPDQLAEHPGPFDTLLGARFLEASGERVVAEIDVRPELHQPAGIVHGGVYTTLVESTASVGAFLWREGERPVVGITNSTDFLRSISEGRLTFTATPVQQGRTLQLWQVDVVDDAGRLVAHGKVKLMNLGGRSD
jgi:1,4-dihydroxy-2-naphthoyl-CoA hydrolase